MTETPGADNQTLLHLLTRGGIGSRRHCFQLITSGQVRVNGRVVTGASTPVDPSSDSISVDGRRVRLEERTVYLKLNKPLGVVSTTSDERGRKTVLDLVPKEYRGFRLYPVGRLDADTAGLILLTNDGELAHRLTHPRFEVEKEYQAVLDQPLTEPQRRALEHGVSVRGRRTAPARVRGIPGQEARYTITLQEGQKHQVRQMFQAVGRTVMRLRCVRIHTLRLGRMLSGEVRELTDQETQSLLALLPSLARPASA